SAWNVFIRDWPVSWWSHYWMITAIAFPLLIAVVTLIWFGIGGFMDMAQFFRALQTLRRDARDDGRVERAETQAQESRSQPAAKVHLAPRSARP
ncbi:MAG: hypothetical protein NZ561_03935, partial [Phycisphaerae bacterium]|nr:hypothetical protein [Phycisphaerae bacterium]